MINLPNYQKDFGMFLDEATIHLSGCFLREATGRKGLSSPERGGTSMSKKTKPAKPGKRFVRWFRHWRSGKVIRAEDYGLKAFYF
jgi:hypothetical protein